MIALSLKPGTRVFNEVYGFGTFKGYSARGLAIVFFPAIKQYHDFERKELTEVE